MSAGFAAAGLPGGVYQTLGAKPGVPCNFWAAAVRDIRTGVFRCQTKLDGKRGLKAGTGVLPNANSRLRSAFDPALFSQQLTDATNQCVVYFVYVPQVQECQAVAQEVGAVFNGDFEQVFGGGFQGVTPRLGLAWDAMGDGRVIVRAGWGMYKSAFPSAVIDETRSALDDPAGITALSGQTSPFITYLTLRCHVRLRRGMGGFALMVFSFSRGV